MKIQGLVAKSLSLYASMRRERASVRQDNTAKQIAQVVVRMLKRRDVVRLASYTELASLTECLAQLTDLGLAVRILAQDQDQAEAGITRAQLRRCLVSPL